MKIFILTTGVALSILFAACGNQVTNQTNTVQTNTTEKESTDIPYTIAKNYFVNNTVNNLDNPKIETKEKFNEIFGMGAHMGKDGTPTEVDFTKQFVLACLLPDTDTATEMKPISLQKNNNNDIVLSYNVKVGAKQSFVIKPFIAIVVDKSYNGNVVLKEIRE